jgi:hypothetical protein
VSRITTGWLARHTPQGPGGRQAASSTSHGLSPPAAWRPVAGAIPYDPGRWQTTRHAADFDEDSIGVLSVPPPSLDALGDQLRTHFGFLADLDSTERRIVAGGAGSRNLVLEALSSLPGSRFADRPLY